MDTNKNELKRYAKSVVLIIEINSVKIRVSSWLLPNG